MVRCRALCRALLPIPLMILLYFPILFSGASVRTAEFPEELFRLLWNVTDASQLTVPNLLIRFSIPMLFLLLYATQIYRQFLVASVYAFTRQNNRARWFLRQNGMLLLEAAIYVLGYLCMIAWIGCRKGMPLDSQILRLLGLEWIAMTGCLFVLTLLQNFLSLFWGSLVALAGSFVHIMVLLLLGQLPLPVNRWLNLMYNLTAIMRPDASCGRVLIPPVLVGALLYGVFLWTIRHRDFCLQNREMM